MKHQFCNSKTCFIIQLLVGCLFPASRFRFLGYIEILIFVFFFIFSTLASLKDLAMMPLGQSFYEVVKMALNLTAASVQDSSLEGKKFASDFL